jgi:raffinose/stachyose/melibiose transport system permease protein
VKWRGGRAKLAYLGLVAPGLAVYLLIVTYPIFYSVWLSLTDFNPNKGGAWNFLGIKHYLAMASDPMFWYALRNNLIVVAVSVFGQIPIGFVLAYILFRKSVRGSRFFQSMVFLPQFLSTIVIGVLWKRLFQADGPIARLMQFVSGNPAAQFDLMLKTGTVMLPVAVALIWMYTGFYMMIFLANLQKVDASMVEAAQIDGARESQILVRVILPLLTSSIFVSIILAVSGSLKGFDLIFAMTSRGLSRQNAMVLAIYMYQTAFDDYRNTLRFAYGAAISNAIVLISVLLILLSNAVRRNMRVDEAE